MTPREAGIAARDWAKRVECLPDVEIVTFTPPPLLVSALPPGFAYTWYGSPTLYLGAGWRRMRRAEIGGITLLDSVPCDPPVGGGVA